MKGSIGSSPSRKQVYLERGSVSDERRGRRKSLLFSLASLRQLAFTKAVGAFHLIVAGKLYGKAIQYFDLYQMYL